MSSHAHGRRRAATVQTNPITALSKAVSSNAGMVGRQAAVVVAASGLVLAAGLPAQAASVSTDRQALESTPLNVVAGDVKAPADATFALDLEAPSSISGADYRAQVAAEEAAAQAAQEQQAAAERAAASRVAAAPAVGGYAGAAPASAGLSAWSQRSNQHSDVPADAGFDVDLPAVVESDLSTGRNDDLDVPDFLK